MTTLPESSPATQKFAEGQDKDVTWVESIVVEVHAEAPPEGFVDAMTRAS
jgi:hypothetical protein